MKSKLERKINYFTLIDRNNFLERDLKIETKEMSDYFIICNSFKTITIRLQDNGNI